MGHVQTILVRPRTIGKWNNREVPSHNKTHCGKNTMHNLKAVYWHKVTPKDDKTATTATANVIFIYRTSVKSIDEVVAPNNAVTSLYKEGDAVWVKNLQRRCTMQSSMMKINSQHSVSVNGIPRHIKDVLIVCQNGCSIYDDITSSDDEAPLLYRQPHEESSSKIDAPKHLE